MRGRVLWLRWLAIAAMVAAACIALGLPRSAGERPFAHWPAGAAVTVERGGDWQRARLTGDERQGLLNALARVRARDAAPGAPPEAPGPTYRIQVGRRSFLYLPRSGRVVWRGHGYRLPPDAGLALRQIAAEVERGFHGELVTWPEASRLFPLHADATLVDLATGLSLRVRRLAGRSHADVQPLTAADTSVLRLIYGGHWSWARRPILVEVAGHRLAAAMNGMPHGAGSIAGNDFPGHFCVHFLLSEVHRSGRIDPDHLLAILAAAGVRPVGPVPPAPVAAEERC